MYAGLDVLRIIMAFFVTILHLEPTSDISQNLTFWLTNCVTRIAVPTFFCISGFLFFRELNMEKLIHQVKRLIYLYIAWTVAYSPMIIFNFCTDEKYYNMSIVMKIVIFVRRFLFISSWTQLWFFLASIYSIPIAYVLLRKFNKRIALTISLAFYLIFACYNDCFQWISNYLSLQYIANIIDILYKIGTIWHGISMGATCLILGSIMYEKRDIFHNHRRLTFIAFAISMILLYIETYIHRTLGAHSFSMMLMGLAVS